MIKQVMDNNISYRIVSLGCFCGVAQEMGRISFRDGSYPFDWLISSCGIYRK